MSKEPFIMADNNFIPLELRVVASAQLDVSKDLENTTSKNINDLFYSSNEEKTEEKENDQESDQQNGQTPGIRN